MKTSPLHSTTKTPALLALVLLAAGATAFPLAARADGDSDREANAAFYNSLDARRTTASAATATVTPPKQARHVGFNKMMLLNKATRRSSTH
jgi:hypothetical protein